MIPRKNELIALIDTASMARKMLLGAAIGLALISLFLLNAGTPDPAWGSLWKLRPLIIMPLAGAMGAAGFYLLVRIFLYLGWNRILAIVLGTLGFIIGLWMGFVLGLDGTMWD